MSVLHNTEVPGADMHSLTPFSVITAGVQSVGAVKHGCGLITDMPVQHRMTVCAYDQSLTGVAGKVKTVRKVNSDLPALLDEWATSLFMELDYVREAQNGVRFKKLYGDLEVTFMLSQSVLSDRSRLLCSISQRSLTAADFHAQSVSAL